MLQFLKRYEEHKKSALLTAAFLGLVAGAGGTTFSGALWVAEGRMAPFITSMRAMADPAISDALTALPTAQAAQDAALAAVEGEFDEAAEERRAIAEAVDGLSVGVANLNQALREATGQDRVIAQPEGLSFVEEPVYRDEDIFITLGIVPTEIGEACRFVSGRTIFRDSSKIPAEGSEIEEWSITGAGEFRIRVTPPKTLSPGRVEFHALLTYDCAGRTVVERTGVLPFRLLAVPRPASDQ